MDFKRVMVWTVALIIAPICAYIGNTLFMLAIPPSENPEAAEEIFFVVSAVLIGGTIGFIAGTIAVCICDKMDNASHKHDDTDY